MLNVEIKELSCLCFFFLTNTSLFATGIAVFCFDTLKVKALNRYGFLVTESHSTMPSLAFEKTVLFLCFVPV